MSKREPSFNLDPETGEMVEIDEELDAAIAVALYFLQHQHMIFVLPEREEALRLLGALLRFPISDLEGY